MYYAFKRYATLDMFFPFQFTCFAGFASTRRTENARSLRWSRDPDSPTILHLITSHLGSQFSEIDSEPLRRIPYGIQIEQNGELQFL